MQKIRPTIDLVNLSPEVQYSILLTLRNSEDPTDYFLFIGKHISGLTLLELGERFSLSSERVRQKLEGIYDRIRVTFLTIMDFEDSTDFLIGPREEDTCQNIAGTRVITIKEL
jgi:hypothetical protein